MSQKKPSLWDTLMGNSEQEETSLWDSIFPENKKEDRKAHRLRMKRDECPHCGSMYTYDKPCPGCGRVNQ